MSSPRTDPAAVLQRFYEAERKYMQSGGPEAGAKEFVAAADGTWRRHGAIRRLWSPHQQGR